VEATLESEGPGISEHWIQW